MYNEDYDGTDLGQHDVSAPARAPGSEVKGVANVYEGKPGENRGTDETMGSGVGGTLTKTGIPPGTEAEAEKTENASTLQKVSDSINGAIDNAIGSTSTNTSTSTSMGPSVGDKK